MRVKGIKAERLTLRELEKKDLDDIREWITDLDMYRYWGCQPSVKDINPELIFHEDYIDRDSLRLGIVLKDLDKVIGDIWVYDFVDDRMAMIGCRISPVYQGHGFASEALKAATEYIFNNTEIKRLWTKVHVKNSASCKMLEACGYSREGLIRSGKMIEMWCDYYIYAIVKRK